MAGLLLFLSSEYCAEGVEIVFQDKTETLSIEGVLGEITIVSLVIHPHSKVSVREEQVSKVEIAYELLIGCIGVVTIAELTIEEQAIVEH